MEIEEMETKDLSLDGDYKAFLDSFAVYLYAIVILLENNEIQTAINSLNSTHDKVLNLSHKLLN